MESDSSDAWWEKRQAHVKQGIGLIEYRANKPILAGRALDFAHTSFVKGSTGLPAGGSALVLPLLTEELLSEPQIAVELYQAVARAVAGRSAVLVSTRLAEHELAGTTSDATEPWQLDVAALVARSELAYLLEQHCVARAVPRASGALYLTPIEARLAHALTKTGIEHEVQVAVGPYRVDFLIAGELAVECDGAAYHEQVADEHRDEALREMGLRTLRISGSEIYGDVAGCVQRISVALSAPALVVPTPTSLSSSQEAPTIHGAGPAWVAAPAGSGKTRVIEARIQRLLTLGVAPARICAISFTNRAVDEMRNRLADADAAGVRFTTLHSLASDISQQRPYGHKRDLVQGVRKPHAPTRWSILKPLLEPAEYKFHRSNDLWTEAINSFRSTYNLPSFDAFPPECQPTVERFEEIHRGYDEQLERSGLTDFEGFVLNAVRLLARNPDARALYGGRYDYWIVDEYQDLAPGKLALLRLLATPARNLFVVGDDDQVIYGFAGATPSVFNTFGTAFPDRGEYVLRENYRCPHELVVRSLWLVERNNERISKDVTPKKKLQPDDMMTVTDDPDYPLRALRFVRQSLGNGVAPEQIALLFRLRDMAIPVEKILAENRIPHLPLSYKSFYERKLVKQLRAWLRVCAGGATADDYRAALTWPTRYLHNETLDTLSSPRFSQALAAGPTEALNWISGWADGLPTNTNTHAAHSFVASARVGRQHSAPAAILEALGLREAAQASPTPANEAPPLIVYDIVNRLADQFDTVDALERWIKTRGDDSDMAIGDNADAATKPVSGRVTLATIHGVKGQEFSAVAVLGPPDGMPDPRAVLPEDLEEERRTAYVAVTRAQEQLLFCASRKYAAELCTRKDGLTWDEYRAGKRHPSATNMPQRPHDQAHPHWEHALRALLEWRREKVAGTRITPSHILTDAALQKVARAWPTTLDAVQSVDLLNASKLRQYGEELLLVLNRAQARL